MGWFYDDDDVRGHEGYLIGLVEEGRGSMLFRELTLRHDGNDVHNPLPLEFVCVGCDCGWRSPRLRVPAGTNWTPSHVWLATGLSDEVIEGYEESARKIWRAHVEQIRKDGDPRLHVDEDGYRWALEQKRRGPVSRPVPAKR